MFLGILFSIIGMIGFALIIYVHNKTWFIVISFASRLVTGFVIIIYRYIKGIHFVFYASVFISCIFIPG
jgi:hypothetical protein